LQFSTRARILQVIFNFSEASKKNRKTFFSKNKKKRKNFSIPKKTNFQKHKFALSQKSPTTKSQHQNTANKWQPPNNQQKKSEKHKKFAPPQKNKTKILRPSGRTW
jgi:hypothetical protein